jgi:hypothetical protein
MVGQPLAPSLVRAVEGFHGVVAVAGSSAVGEDSVVGKGKERVAWGLQWNPIPSSLLRGETKLPTCMGSISCAMLCALCDFLGIGGDQYAER